MHGSLSPDPIADDIVAVQAIGDIRAMLDEVCALTGMGFAAIARVTEHRWVACLVKDDIAFGMEPGDELEIHSTICDEIRASGVGMMIDHVDEEPQWRVHHTPVLYGFQSYISMPIMRADGTFFGTLCALDPEPRTTSLTSAVGRIKDFARQIGEQLDLSPNA